MAANDLSRSIAEMMRECIDENEDALAENSREAGKRAAQLLKQESRARTGAYRKGWKSTVVADETGVECTVHNRVYQLTHLLENGHEIKNQTGQSYGTAVGDGVIARVADKVGHEFLASGGDGA